jgi:hypothetical protein
MRWLICMILVLLGAGSLARGQSLAEAARREAERRRQLAERGVESRTIALDGRATSKQGSEATQTRRSGRDNVTAPAKNSRGRGSANSFRDRLQKLEREISECDERYRKTLQLAQAEKWSLPKVLRSGRSQSSSEPLERLKKQSEELAAKLKRLKRQRLDAYEAGRKAGYLPGELDGKAVDP